MFVQLAISACGSMDEVRWISLPAAGAGALLRLLARLAVIARPMRVGQADVALVSLILILLATATCSHLVASAVVVAVAELSAITIMSIRDASLMLSSPRSRFSRRAGGEGGAT